MDSWQILVGGTLLVAGVMSIGAAILNLNVFFEHPKAAPIVRQFGRTGARAFYVLLGAVLGAIGACALLI